MKASELIVALGLLAVTLANPIAKRDPCDGVNASPVLYHDYFEQDCPAKNKESSDGDCGNGLKFFQQGIFDSTCYGFCQKKTSFTYALESPFPNTYCHGPLTCTVTDTSTTTTSIGGTVTGKFIEAFGVGVSGTYSRATADARARSFSIKLEQGQCGYFTFVPVKREACGTMSDSQYKSSFGGGVVNSYCDTKQINTNKDFCGSDPHLNSDGKADGETIFVRTECANRALLPMDQQDPVYQHPGVAMDRGQMSEIMSTWSNPPSGGEEKPKLECAQTDNNGPHLRRGNIEGKMKSWCESLNQNYIDETEKPRIEEKSTFGSSGTGFVTDLTFSANWVKDVVGEGCPERTRGTEPKHCLAAMYEILDQCGAKDGQTPGDDVPRYGGSKQGDEQCVIWKMDIEELAVAK